MMKTMSINRKNELKDIMNLAWKIARQTGESIGECLRKSWANTKLRSALKNGVVRFTFLKKDGSVREAVGTLRNLEYQARTDRRGTNPMLQVYYDLEKGAFRCFKRENLMSIAM